MPAVFRLLARILVLGLPTLLYGSDWSTRVWSTDDGLPNNHVIAIGQDAAGNLLVTTRAGAAIFDGSHFTAIEPPRSEPDRSLRARTVAGDVWYVKGNNIGVVRDGEFKPAATRTNPRIAAARDGGLWIASDANLAKLAADGTVTECGQFEINGPRPQVIAVMEDRRGAVWIGTATNGLFRYDGTFENIETSYSYILCLAEDVEGDVWVGTDGGGINRITRRVVSLERFAIDQPAIGIQSICEDSAHRLWGVTQNRRLVRREGSRWLRANDEGLRAVDAPLCVAADRNGALWIGTARRTLFRWQAGMLTRWTGADGLLSFSIHSLLPAMDGTVWIGEYSTNAIQRLRQGKVETLAAPATLGIVHALCEDTAGVIWVGTENGLYSVRPDENELSVVPLPAGDRTSAIMSLVATHDGAVWAGSGGGGLIRLQSGRALRITTGQGLPDPYIAQMVDDGLGWLWIGSADHGLFKIRFRQLDQCLADPGFQLRPILYDRNEGLAHMEAYGAHSPDAIGPSAIHTHDGRIWVPMRTALVMVQPQALTEDTRAPTVRLTRIEVDGLPVASPVRVSPNHRRVDLEFSALNLSNPDNVHVRYRLEGIDIGWTDAGARRTASYSRLAPGEYTFRLQSANFDGPWAEAGGRVVLVVRPYYWQTWWFRLAALLGFTAATAGVVHQVSTRRLRARHRLLEQQSALDRERARIARDLHDDLGGSLTQIGVMLDLAQKEPSEEGNAKLGRCVTLVRGASQSVDEIIWAINPRNDTLPYLIDYLSQFVVEYFHAAGVECSIELPDAIAERAVSPETRHHLLLAMKEGATNISRHARATEVRFQVETTDEQVTFTLEDNGTGFSAAPENSTADGLRNIRERMAEIGGSFTIEALPHGGTRLRLIWPCR